jgi:hypothetical protein
MTRIKANILNNQLYLLRFTVEEILEQIKYFDNSYFIENNKIKYLGYI